MPSEASIKYKELTFEISNNQSFNSIIVNIHKIFKSECVATYVKFMLTEYMKIDLELFDCMIKNLENKFRILVYKLGFSKE